MISGFDGCGFLNFGSAGTPPYDSECADRLAEVEVAAVAAPAPLREPGRQRARQRVDRPLQRQHLLARRVHEVDVLGQRLAQRARHRLDAAVGHEPAADLRLDQLPQLLEAAPRTPRGRAGRRARPRSTSPALAAPRSIEPRLRGRRSRAAAACGTGSRCRRRAGPAPCPRTACTAAAGELAQLLAVHVHERVEEHLGELFVATSPSPPPPPLRLAVLERRRPRRCRRRRRRRSPSPSTPPLNSEK